MKKFIVRFLCFFGFLFLSMMAAGSFLFYKFLKPTSIPIEPHTVLTLNIDHSLYDAPGICGDLLRQQQLGVRDIVDILKQAAQDKRIEGIVVYLQSNVFSGIAQIQEFRQAIHKFRQSGKLAIVYTDTFGELSTGIGSYYFATAFEEIWMQPLGGINISGLKVQTPFIRDFLENWGIKPEIHTREQYKNAYDTVKESRMTSAHREALQSLLDSLFSQMLRESAQDREITETVLMQAVDQSPVFNLREGVHQGLIDKIIHKIDVENQINLKMKKKMKFLDFKSYASENSISSLGSLNQGAEPKIAVVFAHGIIAKQVPTTTPLNREGMEIERLIESLSLIEKDATVKAVVLHLDSPGGTPAESEVLWYNLIKMKERMKKPLIISMADMATSGGYWIAAAGDKIIAHPGTITGSIGVLMGKVSSEEFWKKRGIYWEQVETAKNFSIDLIHPFTPAQQQKIEEMIDYTYEFFIQKVASSRKLSIQQVRNVAKGRVWTGEQALQNGLVDALGGLDQAIELAENVAKLTDSEKKSLKIVYLPRPKTLYETIFPILKGHMSIKELNKALINIIKNVIQTFKDWSINIMQTPIEARTDIPKIT